MSRPIPEGVTHNEGTTPSVSAEDLKEPDKDALIRELVGAIQAWAAAGEAFEKRDAYDDNPGDDYNVQEFLRLNKVAMDLNESAHERLTSSLTLARTTCPEAFE